MSTPFDTDEDGVGFARGLLLAFALGLVGLEYLAGPWACESLLSSNGRLVLAFLLLPLVASACAAVATWPFGKLPALVIGTQVAVGAFAVGALAC